MDRLTGSQRMSQTENIKGDIGGYTPEEIKTIREHYIREMKELGIWTGMETDSHDDWRELNDNTF